MRISLAAKLMLSYLLVGGIILATDSFSARRLAFGLGLSAAFGLSLLAVVYVAVPLRRMRAATRAFIQSKWLPVARLRTGDELEDLSAALEELGQKLRMLLVEVGAQESLIIQAVQSYAAPALLCTPDLEPMELNGAMRRAANLNAANEGERLTELLRDPHLVAARSTAEQSGLPVELRLMPSDDAERRAQLVPLMRPNARPLWLLLMDGREPRSEVVDERGPAAAHRVLHSTQAILERLWLAQPALRTELGHLRLKLDEAAFAAGPPESVGVEPVDVAQILGRCLEELRAVYPDRARALHVDPNVHCKIAESAGIAERTLRWLCSGALRNLPAGRSLELAIEIEPAQVRITLDGATPSDLRPVREHAKALGGDAGRVAMRERESAWVCLPRA